MKLARRGLITYSLIALGNLLAAIALDSWLIGCVATFAAYLALDEWLEWRKMDVLQRTIEKIKNLPEDDTGGGA